MKNWLGYAMFNNHFLLMMKILSIPDGQGITQISIMPLNSLLESILILPLIPGKVNALQTQGHCMALNINSTRTLNPTQTPIEVSDQPVYGLTKELMYRYPHLFEKHCSIMGRLHIEQSLLSIIIT